jgi:signal transduction histidine kinase
MRQQAHTSGDRPEVMSGMLGEILFVLLVLTVAALMVVDVVRTPRESPHGQTDRPAYRAERTVVAPSRGPEAVAFSPEPARSVTAVPAPDLGLSRRPERIGPAPGGEPRSSTESAYRKGSRSRPAGSDVRSRILLLAIIPAVTAAVVTLCAVRIVDLLNGTMIHSQISSVHDGAVISVIVACAVLIVALALGLWVTIKAARFVLRPWQGLQAGILQAAGSSDEAGEPGTVFDQMRAEISRLTANETQLRGKLSALFVNLSHRSRSLVERQIRIIENLAHGEQDERRLANLAKMNRIAIHLYRNSENLLILAGQEPSAGSNQPVTLTYLVQAAASEIEDGERVSLDMEPDIAVRGPAAGDAAHLLAELIQNATSFSAADMPVRITGRTLPTGGVLIDITDHGIGMTAKDLAYANWQLENPPATDMDASKWMGLRVVARLAARHRIKVRLQQASSGGLTALVWFPDEVAARQGPGPSPMSNDLASVERVPDLPAAAGLSYATAQRTTAARSVEFASAQVYSQGAPNGPRQASDTGQHADPAWSPGGLRPVPWAAPPVTAPPEQLVTAQAEQLITLQGEPPATVGLSGSGQPDAIAETAGVSGMAAGALGEQTPPVEVIVPPAEDLTRTGEAPIYDEVESHWFGSGRQAPGSSGRTAAAENPWSSPADEGWQAAQTVGSPSSDGATASGLPRRLPKANLVPGSIPNAPPAVPPRSADAARDRLAGLQRGVSEGRATASEKAGAGGKEES